MLKSGTHRPDPRNQVLRDLTNFIFDCRDEGCEVLLMIDANESTDENGSKWGQFLENNMLTDIHLSNGRTPIKTTRLGSKTAIDYMVATDGLLPFIRRTGHLALHEGIVSDHIMLWADIDIKGFFGGEGPSITPPQAREFNSSNVVMRNKFLQELKEIHTHQKLPQ